MMWVLYALAASIVNAIYYIFNQNVRLQHSVFMIYRGILVALMVLPVCLIYKPIEAWQFYAISVVQGLIISYNDLKSFKGYKKYGAENVGSVGPLSVAFVFFFWCLLEPLIILKYCQAPIKTFFILLALFGIIYALMQYRKVKLTKEVFMYMLPVILLSAVISISNKKIMYYADDSLYGLCYWRIFISSLVVGCVHMVIYIAQKQPLPDLIKKENLSKTLFLILMPASMLLRNMAMYYTENPSYVSAVVYTSLLWVMFINRSFHFIHFKRVYLQIEKKWVLLMLASIITLILATN